MMMSPTDQSFLSTSPPRADSAFEDSLRGMNLNLLDRGMSGKSFIPLAASHVTPDEKKPPEELKEEINEQPLEEQKMPLERKMSEEQFLDRSDAYEINLNVTEKVNTTFQVMNEESSSPVLTEMGNSISVASPSRNTTLIHQADSELGSTTMSRSGGGTIMKKAGSINGTMDYKRVQQIDMFSENDTDIDYVHQK